MGFFDRLIGRPTQDDFAHALIKAVRASGEHGAIDYDPKEFRLVAPEKRVLNLGNLYADYMHQPRAVREGLIQRFVRVWQDAQKDDGPQTLDQVRGSLLPKVRERAYYGMLDALVKDKQHAFVPKLLCDHLAVNVVIDTADSVREVSSSTIKDWGVTLDEALTIARENMWKISNENFVRVAPGVYRSPWRDNHDASRIYLHDLIWQLEVKGRHVVATPNRDTLLVTGDGDPEGLQNLAKLLGPAFEEPRSMTAQLAVLNGSAWETYLPPPNHPAFGELHLLALKSLVADNMAQKERLEKQFEEERRDIFVASYLGLTQKSGFSYSFCVWSGQIHTWLPRTEFVQFIDPSNPKEKQILGFARWDVVLAHAGSLMKPQGLFPERWEVLDIPSPEILARLELKEVAG